MEKVKSDNLSVQVIIAALNEEKGIGLTIKEIMQYLVSPRVIVVDGRSVDRTAEVTKNLDVEIFYQDGAGKGDAIAKAVKQIDQLADYVVFIDADYTYPAKSIPEMIKILQENHSIGMVCGNRYGGYQDTAIGNSVFYYGNRVLALIHNLLNGVKLQDPLTGLRVVRADIIRSWQVKSASFDIEVELNHLVERSGFTITEIPIEYRKRIGQKKLGVKHGFTILKRIIREATY